MQTRTSWAVRIMGFNGTLVGAWTGLTGRWRQVKVIMDAVRERVDGHEGVAEVAREGGEKGPRKVVREVADDLRYGEEDCNKNHNQRPTSAPSE